MNWVLGFGVLGIGFGCSPLPDQSLVLAAGSLVCAIDAMVQVGEFQTPLKDGWGITNDGDLMVLSDGTANLTWVDPDNKFKKVRSIEVKANGKQVRNLNEVRGKRGRF